MYQVFKAGKITQLKGLDVPGSGDAAGCVSTMQWRDSRMLCPFPGLRYREVPSCCLTIFPY